MLNEASKSESVSAESAPAEAPSGIAGAVRHLGPGLIITASIVGSGELIMAPKLGASEGFTLLWFIIVGCIIKVFVQIELGRFAISRGLTTLEAMNLMPGPRLGVSWLVWFWLFMYMALIFQVAGIMAGVAQIFPLAGFQGSVRFWMVLVAASCGIILAFGRYQLVQSFSTVMVALFTLFTIFAVVALAWTPYSLSPEKILSGLTFQLPDKFTVAFAAFGIIGVGASELIYYPYWCLEKGYARNVGRNDGSADWLRRARGWIRIMKIDAFVSLVIYTGATVAFYLLGAAVLHGKGLLVSNAEMIPTLSHMYRETFGVWGFTVFLIGGVMVLYSTAFVATASNARLFADTLSVFGVMKYRNAEERIRVVKAACLLLPAASLVLFVLWGQPVSLVLVGALAQGMMLPFLALAAVYFRFRQVDAPLRPGSFWTALLLIATACMLAAGIYQCMDGIRGVFKPAPAVVSEEK